MTDSFDAIRRYLPADERKTLDAIEDAYVRARRTLIEAIGDRTGIAAEAEAIVAERQFLLAAIRRNADETDYCIVCDCHPSHGHASHCPVATEQVSE